jgi:undecaprenyl diphosphate synthase
MAEDTGIPRHVAIIMDGNGRWARERSLPRIKGHEAGAESVRRIIKACRHTEVHYLTLYAFSVENWVRPRAEIEALMKLLIRFLKKDENELHKDRVRLRVTGRINDLPKVVRKELRRVMEDTRENDQGQD